jgi:Phage major tail protein 2.
MVIQGKDVIFAIVDGDSTLPICCARSATVTTTADLGETSTLTTGKWKTFLGLRMSFTISAAGLISDNNYLVTTLSTQQANFEEIQFTFYSQDIDGNVQRYSGSFIITSISRPWNYNSTWEYSLEGQGTGELVIELLEDTFLIIDEDTERVRYE